MASRKTVLLISDLSKRINCWVDYLREKINPAALEILTADNYQQVAAYAHRRKRDGDLMIQVVVVPAKLHYEYTFEGLTFEISKCFPEAIILGFASSTLLQCRLLESGCHEVLLDSGIPEVVMGRVIEILREG